MAFLIARVSGYSHQTYELSDGSVVVGRDKENAEITNNLPTLSRSHAQFTVEGTRIYIDDLQSKNGVYVNGTKITERIELKNGDEIGLGSNDTAHFTISQELPGSNASAVLPAKSSWSLGRGPKNDIILAGDPTISNLHAVITKKKNSLVISDANSLNGVWVDGKRVKKTIIKPQDAVIVGRTALHFTLQADGSLEFLSNEWSKQIKLEAVNLTKTVKGGKTILDGIELNINPGEFVGILGPSGAGKSTLLRALNGYSPPTDGCVLLNEIPLYQNYAYYRNSISYVPQDDIIHKELSVKKTLMYIARLRLPKDITANERALLVDNTIDGLGLGHVANTPVFRLSGGQRKRVSVAAELLTDPSLLFMDEPTSGLDPSTEEKLMQQLRTMSDEKGTTILVTTHILYNLDLLDKVVFIARGKLVFYGTPDEAINYFEVDNQPVSKATEIFEILEAEVANCGTQYRPVEVRLGDKEQAASNFAQAYNESPLYQHHIKGDHSPFGSKLLQLVHHRDELTEEDKKLRKDVLTGGKVKTKKRDFKSPFSLYQLIALTKRQFALRSASLVKTLFLMIIPLILGGLTLTMSNYGYEDPQELEVTLSSIQQQVYYGGSATETAIKNLFSPEHSADPRSAADIVYQLQKQSIVNLPVSLNVIVILVMTAIFCGTFSACLEISTERPVYIRERMAGIKIWDYIGAKIPYLFLITFLQMGLFMALLMTSNTIAQGDLIKAAVALVMVAWVSVAIGLFISTLDSSAGQNSVLLAIIIILPQFVLCGALAPEYFGGMSDIKQYLANIFPARWGTELVLNSIMDVSEPQRTNWIPRVVEDVMGFNYGGRVFSINSLVLLSQFLILLISIRFLLSRLDPIKQ